MKGFYRAMKLRPEYWSNLADDEQTATFVGLLVGFIETDEQIDERKDADALRDEHAELLPRATVGMIKLALLHDGDANTLRSIQASKVCHNVSCTCGSGKKYQRCCAARQRRVPSVLMNKPLDAVVIGPTPQRQSRRLRISRGRGVVRIRAGCVATRGTHGLCPATHRRRCDSPPY